ncbi:MAG: 4Fe-4S dicluster domain-containing protein [Spirochaetales bacterium]|nr:4Fe-4S dicluster domain-containing protein [Spirochaetales bacterium]
MRLKVDTEKCTECGRCTTICSLTKVGRIQPLAARIRITRRWPETPLIAVCRFEDCLGNPCIESCPFDAIRIINGKVEIIEDECQGCAECVAVCPYGAIKMNDQSQKAFKCDLCGGSPACVAECVTGAIIWVEEA